MATSGATGAACLERVYEDLDLLGERLVLSSSRPTRGADPRVWRELGDWLLLGERVGAERIFFVGEDPVLVFSSLPSTASEQDIMEMYRRAWSMARPRCLFVAVGGELRVYALDAPPVASGETARRIEPLEIVERGADVAVALRRFHRERLQSGAAFEHPELAGASGRADQRLLRDVQAATAALIGAGLQARDAHGLIERAILIRYLEDRGVLSEQYFEEVAAGKATWRGALEQPASGPDYGSPSCFIRCLANSSLTYALFERLAHDFNGDLFVVDAHERTVVGAEHLLLLRDLLQGVAGAAQEPLFLWAYDFSVVPSSLVSNMYELFYNQEVEGRGANTHYTPTQLVEFVLADVLSASVLDRSPTVCDPACGSGIFLVEAYRRIVRHEAAKTGKAPSTARLRTLLLERVAGCDIDEAAVRLAAFSLYVAFLNYQSPVDIRQAGPLPKLIHREDARTPAPLVVADAFAEAQPQARSRASGAPGGQSAAAALAWRKSTFGVVVGNPPWSEPQGGAPSLGERWAKARELPVGDRSPSQLFMWRALDLLEQDGVAALLVSAKVLFNVRGTSKAFRERWLSKARVRRVVNFSDVRRDFFERAVAPFALVRFGHAREDADGPLIYETARQVPRGRRGTPAFARLDRRIVEQGTLRAHPHLWKTYSAGNHRDAALVARLGLDSRLGELLPEKPAAHYGYQLVRPGAADARRPDTRWRDLPSLATFESWGPLRQEWLESVPRYVKIAPDPALFLDRCLLVRRGVTPSFGPQARLAEEPLAFRHTTYGIPLGHLPKWQAQVALGTVLSSLGRYWLYMVSGSWGTWKDEIRVDQLLELPLRLDHKHPATRRICAAVQRLPSAAPIPAQLFGEPELEDSVAVLARLDEAVAELFELSSAEHDLVADFWALRGGNASKPPMEMDRYIQVFRAAWQPQLAERVELDARLWRDPRAEVTAAVFETRKARQGGNRRRGDVKGGSGKDDSGRSADATGPGRANVTAEQEIEEARWSALLERHVPALEETRAGGLLTHGMVRAVSESAIVVVKRNEARLWSASAAREDAEATIAQAIAMQRASAPAPER